MKALIIIALLLIVFPGLALFFIKVMIVVYLLPYIIFAILILAAILIMVCA